MVEDERQRMGWMEEDEGWFESSGDGVVDGLSNERKEDDDRR